MSYKSSSLILSILFSTLTYAQQPIEVTDQTLKVGGLKEEVMYFGFAEGDKIIFSFKEIDNKELKEIEITEYPNNAKFSDFKTSRIENKVFNITKQTIYSFRFKNGAVGGRICKISIQRIPVSEATKDFNTAVRWETQQETTYNTYTKDVVVGYDTTFLQRTRKELVKSEQREELVFDKSQRVHSTTNANGNKSDVIFTLPQNQVSEYKSSKVIAWAYWVGVGEEANQAWKQNCQIAAGLVKGTATYFTSPLGALAVGAAFNMVVPKMGEYTYYGLMDIPNRNLFMTNNLCRILDQGSGIAGYRKFNDATMCQGQFAICLSNSNLIQPIEVNVKVVAIVETKEYQDVAFIQTIVTPRYEKRTFSDPIVKTFQVPVTGP